MRCSYSVFQFYSQVEKGNAKLGFYTKYQRYASVRFNMLVYAIVTVLTLVIAAAIQYSSPNPVPFVSGSSCVDKQLYFVAIQLALIIIGVVCVLVKFWHVQDAYHIKTEFKLLLLFAAPSAILWIISKLATIFPPTFETSTLVMAAIMGAMLAFMVFPLVMNMLERRPPKFLRLDSRRSSSHSVGDISDIDKMRQLCLNEELFAILKAKCQRAWCVENALLQGRQRFPAQSVGTITRRPETTCMGNLQHLHQNRVTVGIESGHGRPRRNAKPP